MFRTSLNTAKEGALDNGFEVFKRLALTLLVFIRYLVKYTSKCMTFQDLLSHINLHQRCVSL